MKPLFFICLVLLFATPLTAQTQGHNHEPMDKSVMPPAALGPAKKTEFTSEKGTYLVIAPNLPTSDGMASFPITIKKNGQLAAQASITEAEMLMSGMEMQLPPVEVKALGKGQWHLTFPLSMAGLWKVKIKIAEAGHSDQATLKFITK